MLTLEKPQLHDYSLADWPFPTLVSMVFGCNVSRLQSLHEHYKAPEGLLSREKDQSTEMHRIWYRASQGGRMMDAGILPLYRMFLRSVVKPLFDGEDLAYQAVPTFRVHLPGNVAVGEFHTDAQYGHGDNEYNFWMPFTPAYATNTLALREAGETQMWAVDPGQFLTFDAVRTPHGNLTNETGVTRLSWDFRVIPMSQYRENASRTVNSGQRLVIGEYFEVL